MLMASSSLIPLRYFKARAETQGVEVETSRPWALVNVEGVARHPIRIGVMVTKAELRQDAAGADTVYLKRTVIHDDQGGAHHIFDTKSGQPRPSFVDLQNLWTLRAADDTTQSETAARGLHVADADRLVQQVRARLQAPDPRRGEILGVRLRDSRGAIDKSNDRDLLDAATRRAGIKWKSGTTILPAIVLASDNGLYEASPAVVWPLITVAALVDSEDHRKAGAPLDQGDSAPRLDGNSRSNSGT